MKYEYSAGVIVYYRRAQLLHYLLLHYSSGHWDFPKGHIEKNETKQEAALRELKEETSLVAILDTDFEESLTYFFADPKTKELIKKRVYFFIGRTRRKKVYLSPEHIGFKWLEYHDAYEQLTYENARVVLKKAHHYLSQY